MASRASGAYSLIKPRMAATIAPWRKPIVMPDLLELIQATGFFCP
jgi:hypothetical protein